MTTQPKTFDHDFNDSLDDIFDGSHLPKKAGELPSIKEELLKNTHVERIQKIAAAKLFEENCPSCRGTGEFRSYTGRYVGRCFKCKGAGKFQFKQSAAERAKARETQATRKAQHIADAIEGFKAAHAAEYAWLIANAPRFDFARDLLDKLPRYGLSDKQVAAIQRCIQREGERQAAREAAKADVDGTKILDAFATARANRNLNVATDNDVGVIDKLPTLRLAIGDEAFVCKPARKDPNIIYVTSGETYLGKIVEGKFTRSRECTDSQEKALVEAAANPSAAAKAYGLRYAICSCCGRQLTNEISRREGIGPICATKWGL